MIGAFTRWFSTLTPFAQEKLVMQMQYRTLRMQTFIHGESHIEQLRQIMRQSKVLA